MTHFQEGQLLRLWGKSDAGGQPHSLLGHLLDTAAVAEIIWYSFLSPNIKCALDRCCRGRGRDVFVLLAAWHDLGKATPAFQGQVEWLKKGVQDAGWPFPAAGKQESLHAQRGAVVAARILANSAATGTEWLPLIIAGHHGSVQAFDCRRMRRSYGQRGDQNDQESENLWERAQLEIAGFVRDSVRVELSDLNLETPSYALQWALAGYVSMADWIASSDQFQGSGTDIVSMERSRDRAERAWASLGFEQTSNPFEDPSEFKFETRFGFTPHPMQSMVVRKARSLPEPGLIVIEGPMGDGKTEAGLAAVEVLGGRFGVAGLVFGMPTQGTSDAIFARCDKWMNVVAPGVSVSLLHGKAMANESWRDKVADVDVAGVEEDEYGLLTQYDVGNGASPAVHWLLGRHRGLLGQAVVCTVDQVLFIATHIKYSSMRMAGLIGKVLVIDEVHSYDVYMTQYLHTLLKWCSDGNIPVVLMSATLPPEQRSALVSAYVSGWSGPEDQLSVEVGGYPAVTTWTPQTGVAVETCEQARPDLLVQVGLARESDINDTEALARLVLEEAGHEGHVLVILNTVRRAQEVYQHLRSSGIETVLLHGRLTTGERASRAADLIKRMGGPIRLEPQLVVVATQIAEQSFDVDADLLITDLAPMDLLLQRIGRLHRRHDRSSSRRPLSMTSPRCLVTGVQWSEEGPPAIAGGFDRVYTKETLLRSTELLGRAGQVWQVPSCVPGLVARAYDKTRPWPAGWEAEGEEAAQSAADERGRTSARAEFGLLEAPIHGDGTLRSLHRLGSESDADRIAVRDGEPNLEVALVRRDVGRGIYTTLAGRPLGVNGERASSDGVAREVLADTVRIREGEEVGDLRTLPGWSDVPLLRDLPKLVLIDGKAVGSWGTATYDNELGLVIQRRAAR